MTIQDLRRSVRYPTSLGGSLEDQVRQLKDYYQRLVQEVLDVHNAIQTGTMVDVAGGTTVFVFTWQTPWPTPVSYRCFASLSWQATYTHSRNAAGTQTTFTTSAAAPAGGTVLILGVA